jgi:hypothetical protein
MPQHLIMSFMTPKFKSFVPVMTSKGKVRLNPLVVPATLAPYHRVRKRRDFPD